MRKALASAALAAMLSIGIGTTAVAHAAGVTASQEVNADESDDDGGLDAGLFGLLGLLGLAGLLGRGGGGGRAKSGGSSGGKGYAAPRAPKGGHTTDWSSR
ncbi:MAG: hypothetical protein QOH36_871 [Actinomycetota bacterium]|jgi:hypothetical protein|nr:hypothetical protein [Actinomycetota bacterium]MEA2974176.1 hypothetical protein [Actinomycetota bacterium]